MKSNNSDYGFSTRALHSGYKPDPQTGATAVPIYESASFAYKTAEELEQVFSGRQFGYVYSRISNPTVVALEQKMSALEQGRGAVAVASGMAAITSVLYALTKPGDEVLVSKSLFGGTFLLLREIFEAYGVTVTYVEATDTNAYQKALTDKTRCIFLETLGNPKLDVPDIPAVAAIARQAEIPLIADSTLTTPYLFAARDQGVDIVIHSTTKYITGNGTAIGGIAVDLGNFDWTGCHSERVKNASAASGEFAFLYCLRKQVVQNTGCCLSPFAAFIQNLGLETLSLRMEKHCSNAFRLAQELQQLEPIMELNYPGLPDNPYHSRAAALFSGDFGALLTFKLKTKEQCFRFINNLNIARNLANLGDAKTLVIHPASTIYHECSAEE